MGTLKANWDYLTNLISTKKSMGFKSASLITLTVTPMQLTLGGKQFLLFDTGSNKSYRIVCFATKKNLMKLLEAEQWLADANFRSAPRKFGHIWSIHAQFNTRTLPLFYFMMTSQTQATYEDALKRLKAELDLLLPEFCQNYPSKRRAKLQSHPPSLNQVLHFPTIRIS